MAVVVEFIYGACQAASPLSHRLERQKVAVDLFEEADLAAKAHRNLLRDRFFGIPPGVMVGAIYRGLYACPKANYVASEAIERLNALGLSGDFFN